MFFRGKGAPSPLPSDPSSSSSSPPAASTSTSTSTITSTPQSTSGNPSASLPTPTPSSPNPFIQQPPTHVQSPTLTHHLNMNKHNHAHTSIYPPRPRYAVISVRVGPVLLCLARPRASKRVYDLFVESGSWIAEPYAPWRALRRRWRQLICEGSVACAEGSVACSYS